MEPSYLIDPNVIIDFLAEKLPPSGMELVATAIDAAFRISFVNQIEVLAYATRSTMKWNQYPTSSLSPIFHPATPAPGRSL